MLALDYTPAWHDRGAKICLATCMRVTRAWGGVRRDPAVSEQAFCKSCTSLNHRAGRSVVPGHGSHSRPSGRTVELGHCMPPVGVSAPQKAGVCFRSVVPRNGREEESSQISDTALWIVCLASSSLLSPSVACEAHNILLLYVKRQRLVPISVQCLVRVS